MTESRSPFLLPRLIAVFALAAATAMAAETGPPSIEQKTAGMRRIDGFMPLYWDAHEGKLYLEISRFDQDLLYVTSLPAGVGSNDIGLDRGQLGGEKVVVFQRVGPKVLMIQPNTEYRAESASPDERRAVQEAFARSALWGFGVVAESGERVLVDATRFALRDAHGVAATLRRTHQGSYSLDASRSALYLPRTKGFPRNTEIEATLTFTTSDDPGKWISSVTPTPEAVTVREHHSFVELPDAGYTPRRSDPRAGFITLSYRDYAAPLGESMTRRLILRHRLQKKDPSAAISEPVTPIVYYVDRGTPEPIRSALIEGASWWETAFEAAGFRNAFRVELLPEGADPMDIRYNVIQWVHRSTRGWSYGASVADPRTGEILKGHVSLGSLRVRQDYLIAEGLLSPYPTGDEHPAAVEAMALARIRQLAAHEVGHTLGLVHNYIASTEGRTSVMDYPAPLVKLRADGSLDTSDAYATGIGEWDKVAIDYGYREFPKGTDERKALVGILTGARERGITFLTDQDARPPGSAHPRTHLWDNGKDAAAELGRVMAVRRAALDRFGESAIRRGMPLATMEEVLVPLYLHHRYQVEAAIKMIAGLDYVYAMRGDGLTPRKAVPGPDQRRALDAVLATLDPAVLALPRRVVDVLPPRPFTYPFHRELFPRYTGLVFDAVSPAVVAADLTTRLLLDPQRAARLTEQHALDPELPGLEEVLAALLNHVFHPKTASPYEAEIGRAVEGVVVDGLLRLATQASMPEVRAEAELRLERLAGQLDTVGSTAPEADEAHDRLLAREIRRFLTRPEAPNAPPAPLVAPPGSPIGGGGPWLGALAPDCLEEN